MRRRCLWACILPAIAAGAMAGLLMATEIPVSQWDWPEDRVEIRPYLLELKPDAAVLRWVTPVEKLGRLKLSSLYGEETNQEEVPTRYHKMELEKLHPATFYRYEIDGLYQGEFVTPDEDRSFRVAVVGHTHGTEPKLHYPDELLVSRLVDLAPDFAVHCGDTTYHATIDEFRKFFFRPFAKALSKFPVFVSAGNHDAGWPGVYGISFDNFRRLFPHDFGAGEGAYYSFVYKHVKFIALSYTTLGLGKDSSQYEWLARELDESTSEFNVVFLGGSYPPDLISELFDFLSTHRVDFVLGGDGSGAFQKEINGIPYFFTGTTFRNPHPMRLIDFSPYSATFREFDAKGKMKPTLFTVNTKRPKIKVRDLTDTTSHRVNFKEESVKSMRFRGFTLSETVTIRRINTDVNAFDGIFIKAKCQGSRDGVLRVYWRSSEMIEKAPLFQYGNEHWDRLQQVGLMVGSSNEFTLAMPSADPLNGKPYNLADLRLVNDSEGCEEEIEISEFFLFRDQE